jgi:hypothetical protein
MMTDVHVPSSNIVMDIFSSIGPDVGETLKWDMTLFRTQASLCKIFEDAGLEVEQVWESEVYGSKEIDVEDAKGIFEEAVQNPMFANFGTEGVRDRAQVEFIRRLKGLGGTERKIIDHEVWEHGKSALKSEIQLVTKSLNRRHESWRREIIGPSAQSCSVR